MATVDSAIHASGKETWQLVKFTNRRTGAVLAAYTDLDSDYVFAGQLFTSTPSMEVKLPKNTGLLDKDPLNLIVPIADTMTRRITDGILTQFLIDVTVSEVIKSEGHTTNNLTSFIGLIVGAAKNFSGREGILALSALTVKAQLDRMIIGMPTGLHCANNLGDLRCQVNMGISDRTITKEVSAINSKEITISTGIPSGKGDRFYAKGYMEFDGISVMIQEWRDEIEGDKTIFFMQERVPNEWLGETVTIRSGCDKTVETCRFRYSNEEHNNSLGYAIPKYHPLFEQGVSRQ